MVIKHFPMVGKHIPRKPRKDVIRDAQAYLASHPLYLDTETTGVHNQAEVIEVGIIDDDGKVLYDQLVHPRGKMDPASLRVHGLTLEMLANEPTWDKVGPQVEALLVGRKVIGYNIEFDLRVMKHSHTLSWMRWTLPETNFIDIMGLYAQFNNDWDMDNRTCRIQSLEMAGRQCNISLQNTHHAVDDCLLTRALLHHIASSV